RLAGDRGREAPQDLRRGGRIRDVAAVLLRLLGEPRGVAALAGAPGQGGHAALQGAGAEVGSGADVRPRRVDEEELKWHDLGMAITRAAVVLERTAGAASRTAMRKAESYLKDIGCRTERFEAATATWGGLIDAHADIVLLSTGPSGKESRLVVELKRHRDAFPATCVLVDAFSAKSVSRAYSCGATVVAPATAFVDAVRNLVSVAAKDAAPTAAAQARHPLEQAVVAPFHEPHPGRLDARRVAEAYGLSLSSLAGALGVTQSALSKRSAAPAAQPGLRELEFAWAVLLDALG